MSKTILALAAAALFFGGLFGAASNSLATTFAVMGDTQRFEAGIANGSLQTAVKQIKKKKVQAVVAMGDLKGDCYDDDSCLSNFNSWKSAMSPIYKKTYAVMGNHDRLYSGADALWQSVFNLPTNGPENYSELAYAFNKGDSHFVVLNSSKPNDYAVDSNQRNWLEQDLSRNKKMNVFVFFHMPAFPVSSHIGSALDVYPAERDALWEILDRHKVTAVFSGHEHIFSRKKIDSSVFSGATKSIYQFTVGNTDSIAYAAPQEGLSEYYNLEKHFLIVKTSKKKIVTELYSATTGKKLNSFSFRK
ncbi:MAG: metallophosphoesterase [Candidatus Moranbacteria bacterium]|nr:metallophosphoesterase [Candidatus Moranbacteria bacterium]